MNESFASPQSFVFILVIIHSIALGRFATSDHETSNVETGDAETSDRGSSENKLSL